MMSTASARSSAVMSITSSGVSPWRSKGGGLVENGCVDEARSPGTSEGGTGRSSIGQTGFPVLRSKTKTNPGLVICATASIAWSPTVMSASTGAAGRSWSQNP